MHAYKRAGLRKNASTGVNYLPAYHTTVPLYILSWWISVTMKRKHMWS